MAVELQHFTNLNSSGPNSHDNPSFQGDGPEKQGTFSNEMTIEMPQNATISDKNTSGYTKFILAMQKRPRRFLRRHRKALIRIIEICLLLLYFAYFGYSLYYKFGDEGSIRLLVCTILGVSLLLFRFIFHLTKQHWSSFYEKIKKICLNNESIQKFLRTADWFLKVAIVIFLVVYIIIDVAIDHPENLISVAGLAIYILIFYIFSVNPSKVKWHTVFRGIVLQYIFALIILRQKWGYDAFQWLGDRVAEFLSYSEAGAEFLFNKPLEVHFFIFKVLPIIVFFFSVINILYYLGIMQATVRVIGRFLAFCMDTTPAESLNAAGNIFVGMTEAPLLISPFLKDMTLSELHAIMTGGFATIAGSVLGAYISFGVPANHLISASVMSAPAALAISKLAYPEVEVSKATNKDFYKIKESKERNVVEAASAGATKSIKIAAAIAANVLAFLSLLEFVNATLTWFGDRAGVEDLTLQFICSYVFFPISFFMGTEVDDCRKVAELIGIKTFTNEFIAYSELSIIIQNNKDLQNYLQFYNESYYSLDNGDIVLNGTGEVLKGGILSRKSEVIATYALCGFANFGSMGILLGGLGALAPSRKSDLAKLIIRAMVSGTAACFLTACVAGLLYKEY